MRFIAWIPNFQMSRFPDFEIVMFLFLLERLYSSSPDPQLIFSPQDDAHRRALRSHLDPSLNASRHHTQRKEALLKPAGMLDDETGDFTGAAAKELKEETGLEINIKDLINMSKIIMKRPYLALSE